MVEGRGGCGGGAKSEVADWEADRVDFGFVGEVGEVCVWKGGGVVVLPSVSRGGEAVGGYGSGGMINQ